MDFDLITVEQIASDVSTIGLHAAPRRGPWTFMAEAGHLPK